jgi:hypothetical protein
LGTLEEDMFAKAVELITGISIAEPARVATDNFLKNARSILTEGESRKQVLHVDF